MAVSVTLNGVTYSIPEPNDAAGWGQSVSSYLQALSTGALTKSGGAFTLLGEPDFGPTYGLKSAYFKSRTTGAASSGALRLAVADTLSWRNNANNADLPLGINASNQLTFNGVAVGGGSGPVDAPYVLASDYATLALAITAATAANLPLILDPTTYSLTTELVPSAFVRIIGAGKDQTVIQATAAITSCILLNAKVEISNLTISGNDLATYAMRGQDCSFSIFNKVVFTQAVRDGVYFPQAGVNDALSYYDCQFLANGRAYATTGMDLSATTLAGQITTVAGTVSITSGSPVVTGVGTNFSAIPARIGDLIKLDAASPVYYEILSVDSATQITLNINASVTRSGKDFAIGVGRGYTEMSHNDNNVNNFYGGLFRYNAGGNMQIAGLYGAHILNTQFDFCDFYAIKVGIATSAIIHPLIQSCYFEAIDPKPLLFGAAVCAAVINPMTYGYASPWDVMGSGVSGYFTGGTSAGYGTYPLGALSGFTDYTGAAKTSESGFALNSAILQTFQNASFVAGTTVAIAISTTLASCSSAAPVTMTATPTIDVGTNTQEVLFVNTSGNSITLQDDSVLAGSKLFLAGGANVTLTPTSTIKLMYISGAGAGWYETSRSIR